MGLKGGLSQLKFENLYNQFLGLQPREQTMALVGMGVALVVIVVAPIWWASDNLSKLQRTLDQGQTSTNAIVREIDDYNKKKADLTALETKLRTGFDSNANVTLENLAKTGNIEYDIRAKSTPVPKDLYNENSVEVSLKKASIKQIVDYLYQIEYGGKSIMRIDKLRLKPAYGNRQQLDAKFDVISFQLQEVKEEAPVEPAKDKGKK